MPVTHRLRLAREHLEPGRQLDPLVERLTHLARDVRQVDTLVVLLAQRVNRGADRGARARLGRVHRLVRDVLKNCLVRPVVAAQRRRSDVEILPAAHTENDLSQPPLA
jgi:hypothetical protein